MRNQPTQLLDSFLSIKHSSEEKPPKERLASVLKVLLFVCKAFHSCCFIEQLHESALNGPRGSLIPSAGV